MLSKPLMMGCAIAAVFAGVLAKLVQLMNIVTAISEIFAGQPMRPALAAYGLNSAHRNTHLFVVVTEKPIRMNALRMEMA